MKSVSQGQRALVGGLPPSVGDRVISRYGVLGILYFLIRFWRRVGEPRHSGHIESGDSKATFRYNGHGLVEHLAFTESIRYKN